MNYTQALYKNRWCDIVSSKNKYLVIFYMEENLKVKIKDIKEYR
ncbi:MAG: hypothetical protein U5K55_14765 [Aliarcobacter sp.]|nr:hypothetical protein [Aliarcobacter sp.]